MKKFQTGFGFIHVLLGIGAIAGITMVAVPKYQAYVNKAKLGEAVTLGGQSKDKVAEFYMMRARFPRNENEAEQVTIQTVSPPEYVSEIIVNPENAPDSVTIEIHLKDGVIENKTEDQDQYLFYTAIESPLENVEIEWVCGAYGLEENLLPEDCSGQTLEEMIDDVSTRPDPAG